MFMRSKTCRLGAMLTLTFSFFLVELVVGHITGSLAMVGDSYHMLSDVVALVVGIASVRISKLRSRKNTYGWARAEVVGALVNSVFLVALCFTIFTEAIERLTSVEEIHHEMMMLYVGIIGFLINLLGLLLLRGHAHGHSHGGHGHSHAHSHGSTNKLTEAVDTMAKEKMNLHDGDGEDDDEDIDVKVSEVVANMEDGVLEVDVIRGKPKIKSSAQLNMRGVFLHVLGDALGSLVVIISALLIIFCEGDWKYKVDPALSIVLVVIVLSTTIPLMKESSLILLQTVPTHIQVAALKEKLLENVSGVLAVHEFHVWQLAGNRIIASAHIRCQSLRDYMLIAEQVKSFFHDEGIHSTTIQPEFVEYPERMTSEDCLLECGPDKTCHVDTCCARANDPNATSNATGLVGDDCVIRQRNVTSVVAGSEALGGSGIVRQGGSGIGGVVFQGGSGDGGDCGEV